MTKLLGHKIHADNFKPDVIFAVSPGGLMIAEWLSRRELGNRTNPIPVRAVFVKQERTEKEIQVERAHVENEPDEISKISGESKVLVVIDVARGGQTLGETYKYLRGHFPAENLRTAALFKTKKVRVNYFVTETDKQINFQWKQD